MNKTQHYTNKDTHQTKSTHKQRKQGSKNP